MPDDDAYVKAAIHALPDPVAGVDDGGRIRGWNAAATRRFGITEDAALGRSLSDLVDIESGFVRGARGDGMGVIVERVQCSGVIRGLETLVVLRPVAIPSTSSPFSSLAPEVVEGLGPRLRQTLEALCEGLSEKEVAARLGLSPHTIHGYVKDLHRRFDVQSRGELVARVWARSLAAAAPRNLG